jgi:hypothetical protein
MYYVDKVEVDSEVVRKSYRPFSVIASSFGIWSLLGARHSATQDWDDTGLLIQILGLDRFLILF